LPVAVELVIAFEILKVSLLVVTAVAIKAVAHKPGISSVVSNAYYLDTTGV
jgi:hypothetical protein